MAAKKKETSVKKPQTRVTKSISVKMTKTVKVRRSVRNYSATPPAVVQKKKAVKKVVVTKSAVKTIVQQQEIKARSANTNEESIEEPATEIKSPVVRRGKSLPKRSNASKELPTTLKVEIQEGPKTRRSLKNQEITPAPESSNSQNEEAIKILPKTRRSGRKSTNPVISETLNPDQILNLEESMISSTEIPAIIENSVVNEKPIIIEKPAKSTNKRISNRLRSKQNDVTQEVENDVSQENYVKDQQIVNECNSTPSDNSMSLRRSRRSNLAPIPNEQPTNSENTSVLEVTEDNSISEPKKRGRKRKISEEKLNNDVTIGSLNESKEAVKEIKKRGRKPKLIVAESTNSLETSIEEPIPINTEVPISLSRDEEIEYEPFVLGRKTDDVNPIPESNDTSNNLEVNCSIPVPEINDILEVNSSIPEINGILNNLEEQQEVDLEPSITIQKNDDIVKVSDEIEFSTNQQENVQIESKNIPSESSNEIIEEESISNSKEEENCTILDIPIEIDEIVSQKSCEIIEVIDQQIDEPIREESCIQSPVEEIDDKCEEQPILTNEEKLDEAEPSNSKSSNVEKSTNETKVSQNEEVNQRIIQTPPSFTIIREAVQVTVKQDMPDEKNPQASIKILLQDKSNIRRISIKECLKLSPKVVEVEPIPPPLLIKPQKPKKLRQVKVAKIVQKKLKHKEIDDCIIRCDVDLVTNNDRAPKCKCKVADNKFCQMESCLNRAMRYECPKRCDYGNACKNRRFQNCEYAKLECFDTEKKGRGLRALEPIKRGGFIIEYIGEIIDINKFNKRSKRYEIDPRHKHHYVMSLNSNTYIDATKRGNIARFINHSCDPNAATEKWTVDRRNRIGFFALKDIQAGEEIVFDYKFERYGKTAQKCYCGSSNCRGIICAETDDKKDLLAGDAAMSSDSSDESSSDEFEMTEVDNTFEMVEEKVDEEVKQVRSKELNEKYEKSAFKGYRIPKKQQIQTPVEVLRPIEDEIVKVERKLDEDSDSPKTTKRRRKSRFGPISPQASCLPPPQLIQIQRPNMPNSSCSNTCSSSSSTPSQPGLTPNYPETNATISNNNLTISNGNSEVHIESQHQKLNRQHKTVFHAYAGVAPESQSREFLPPFPPMGFAVPSYFYPIMPGMEMQFPGMTPEMPQFPFAIPTMNFGMQFMAPPPPPPESDVSADKPVEPT